MKLFHRIGQIRKAGTLVMLVSSVQLCLSQTVEKNSQGERIIKYDDGTWRYFEGSDSLLLDQSRPLDASRDFQPRADSLPKPLQYDYRLFQRYIAAAVQYESRMLDRVDESSGEVHGLEDQIAAAEAENNISEASRLRAELEILEDRRQDEQRILSHSRSLIKRVLKIGKNEKYERLAKISIPEFNPSSPETNRPEVSEELITPIEQFLPVDEEIYTLDETEEEVNVTEAPNDHSDSTAMANDTEKPEEETSVPTKEQPLEVEEKSNSGPAVPVGDLSEAQEKEVDVNALDTNLVAESTLEAVKELESEETDKELPPEKPDLEALPNDPGLAISTEETAIDTLQEQEVEIGTESSLSSGVTEADTSERVSVANTPEIMGGSSEVRTSRPAPTYNASIQDRWFSPNTTTAPEYECKYTFNGIDQITNRKKRELREEIFFTHTDERLKPYLKDRDYVTCGGYLTSISGGFRYLTLIVRIASRNAVREYGSVQTGSLLNLKLLNGETVSLFSSADHQGLQDPKSGDTLYKVRYPIDYQKEKLLTKSGIDKVRIVWSSGYEDYEVYNVNFFSNQLDCLNGK